MRGALPVLLLAVVIAPHAESVAAPFTSAFTFTPDADAPCRVTVAAEGVLSDSPPRMHALLLFGDGCTEAPTQRVCGVWGHRDQSSMRVTIYGEGCLGVPVALWIETDPLPPGPGNTAAATLSFDEADWSVRSAGHVTIAS